MSVEQVKYILFICKNYSLVCNPHEYEWVQLPNMIFEDKNTAIEYLQSEELQTHFEELKNSILLQMYEYLQKFKSNIFSFKLNSHDKNIFFVNINTLIKSPKLSSVAVFLRISSFFSTTL